MTPQHDEALADDQHGPNVELAQRSDGMIRIMDQPGRALEPQLDRRLKILIWHIHGSYLAALSAIDHDWYLPVSDEYGGRRLDSPEYVREVPAAQVRDLDLDLV